MHLPGDARAFRGGGEPGPLVALDLQPSRRGSDQARRPSSAVIAGTMVIRTTKASKRTAAARPRPIDLVIDSSLKTNPENTAITMTAAAVTTRAPCRNPATTASSGAAPCTYSSRMRVTRKTW